MYAYELTVPVPVAELDPFGVLKPAAQIRILQLTAARASAAVGFDTAWYERNGTTWVVRYTRIEQLDAARHDDELLIRTWVSDFRRVRSWRQYEITRRADGAILARAKTDWVYVNTVANAPTAVPLELQQAFMPAGVTTEERPMRLRLPADAVPQRVELRRAELADLDSLGHVNNSIYLSFVEQALFEVLGAAGWHQDLGAASPHLRAHSLELEYFKPTLFRQQLSARIIVSSPDPSAASTAVEILADGEPAAVATGLWSWSDGELPSELRAAISRATSQPGHGRRTPMGK